MVDPNLLFVGNGWGHLSDSSGLSQLSQPFASVGLCDQNTVFWDFCGWGCPLLLCSDDSAARLTGLMGWSCGELHCGRACGSTAAVHCAVGGPMGSQRLQPVMYVPSGDSKATAPGVAACGRKEPLELALGGASLIGLSQG